MEGQEAPSHCLVSRLLPQAQQVPAGNQARLACCSLRWAGRTHGLRPTQQLPMIMGFARVSEACRDWPLAIPSQEAVSLINNHPRTGNRRQAEEPYRYFEPVERQGYQLASTFMCPCFFCPPQNAKPSTCTPIRMNPTL